MRHWKLAHLPVRRENEKKGGGFSYLISSF